jgi:hypothetical protein
MKTPTNKAPEVLSEVLLEYTDDVPRMALCDKLEARVSALCLLARAICAPDRESPADYGVWFYHVICELDLAEYDEETDQLSLTRAGWAMLDLLFKQFGLCKLNETERTNDDERL